MAIIERVEGLEAIVKVGGTALPEYDDLNGDDDVEQVESLLALASKNRFVDARMIRHVVKYVEAISDAEFEVVFTKRQSFQHHSHHIAFQLENDNHAFGLTHEPEECREKEWNYSCEHRAFLDGEKNWCRQHFKFGPLRLVKPAASTSNPHDPYIDPHRDLGVLRISVHHMQFTNAIELPFGHVQSVTDSINEEALKGQTVTHIVHYGDLEPSKEPKDIPMDVYQDPLQRPFAIFEFRYLSKDALIAKGVNYVPISVKKVHQQQELGTSVQEKHKLHDSKDSKIKQERGESTFNEQHIAKRSKRGIIHGGEAEMAMKDHDPNQDAPWEWE